MAPAGAIKTAAPDMVGRRTEAAPAEADADMRVPKPIVKRRSEGPIARGHDLEEWLSRTTGEMGASITRPEKRSTPTGRPSPPVEVPPREMLTPSEVASLRQWSKETSAYFQKAFADLRPKAEPNDEK